MTNITLNAKSPGRSLAKRLEVILVDSEEVKISDPVISCDGGGGGSGHPLVYLNTGEKGLVDCPYCGKKYVLCSKPEMANS